MKKIILFLLISNIIFSQTLEKVTDDFNQDEVITCKTQKKVGLFISSIAKEYITSISLKAIKKENVLKFTGLQLEVMTNPDIRCYSKETGSITLLLENKAQIKLKQISDLKCDQNSRILYIIDSVDLQTLSIIGIEKIRVMTTEGYYDLTIKTNKLNFIKDTFTVFNDNL
jgi:hypothetical protein